MSYSIRSESRTKVNDNGMSIAIYLMHSTNMEEQKINKDLVLREKLAIERTVMANQRTFLSFLRTALYFSIAGITINELMVLKHGEIIVVLFWIISFLLLLVGLITYLNQRKKIAISRNHIGSYKMDYEEDL